MSAENIQQLGEICEIHKTCISTQSQLVLNCSLHYFGINMQTSIGGYDMYIYQSIQAVAWLALQTSDLKILDSNPEDLSNDAYAMFLCFFFLTVLK